jgi:HK97 family phage major capsid protein
VAYGGAARANDPDPIRTHGFKSASEFAVAVRNAQVGRGVDERLGGPVIEGAQPATFNQNQGPGDEGFLAPPEYSQAIWDLAMTDLDILAMTNPEPTSSSAIIKPKDDTTPWGAVGVQARWASEASQYTPSAAKLNGDLMTLQKLFAFVPATDEILQDAPMLRNRLTTQAGRAIAWAASESVMWGTGAGQPTGFMNSPALITVAAAAGENTPTLSVTDLSNMLARVLRRGGRKPVWLVNQDVLPSLIPLSIGNYPVWIPINAGLRETVWDGTIFGYPVMFTEHAQTLGTVGDITLFNPDGYYAVTRQGGVDFAESMHLYFDQGLTAFRWTFRLAGTPYLSKPVSPAKGATTKSHFVALAAR